MGLPKLKSTKVVYLTNHDFTQLEYMQKSKSMYLAVSEEVLYNFYDI